MSRQTGKVKWYNNEKGFGFIAQDEGEDLFVSYPHIEEAYRWSGLQEGQSVSFIPERGQKGMQATQVTVGSTPPRPWLIQLVVDVTLLALVAAVCIIGWMLWRKYA